MNAETVFESAQAFIARHLDGTPAEVWDSWQIAWHGVDYGPARDALPGCLADLWHCEREFRGALETAVYAHAVADAWVSAELPLQALDRAETFKDIRESRYPYLGVVMLTTVAEPAWMLAEMTAAYGRGEPEIIAEVSADNVEVLR